MIWGIQMSNNVITSLDIQVMTVKGYTEAGYQLGTLEFNVTDYFIAPWYGPIEGFYSKLPVGTNVLTKKVPGETRLCHIIGIDRNTIEDTVGILNGLPDEKTLNTEIDPLTNDVMVFKRGVGQLLLSEDSLGLFTPFGYGHKIVNYPNSIDSALLSMGDSSLYVTSGVERVSGRLFVPKSGSSSGSKFSFENFGNADQTVFGRFKNSGIFTNSKVSEIQKRINLAKNYNRVTYKYMGKEFVGFDMFRSISKGSFLSKSNARSVLDSNPYFGHHFVPNDAIVEIYGGIFSISGYEYDMSFNELRYGNSAGKRSSNLLDLARTEAAFSRGIAKFSSTNTSVFNQSDIGIDIFENNISITDREGFSKISVGKSSFKGNLPVLTKVTLNSRPGTDITQKSEIDVKNKKERNPVIFYKESGSKIPATIQTKRESGTRYLDVSSNNKNNDSGQFRSNSTRYHNMFAAAEQMFGAYPKKIVNATSGGIISKRLEYWYSDGATSQSDKSGAGAEEIGALRNKASGSSYIIVGPDAPAMKTGGAIGDLFVAGKNRREEKPFSNKFNVSKDGNISQDDNFESAGGYSALLDAAGAITASIGKNDADGLSAVIDTQGGIVSWIGSDNNGRSITTQTDGSINICVGGPELSENSNKTYNPGRMEIRVSVVDKGFVGSEKTVREGDSDYIISISEKGLIIAGGKKNKPIVISSNGDLNLESVHGDVNLVSNEGRIRYKTGSGQFNDLDIRPVDELSTGKYLSRAAKAAGAGSNG